MKPTGEPTRAVTKAVARSTLLAAGACTTRRRKLNVALLSPAGKHKQKKKKKKKGKKKKNKKKKKKKKEPQTKIKRAAAFPCKKKKKKKKRIKKKKKKRKAKKEINTNFTGANPLGRGVKPIEQRRDENSRLRKNKGGGNRRKQKVEGNQEIRARMVAWHILF